MVKHKEKKMFFDNFSSFSSNHNFTTEGWRVTLLKLIHMFKFGSEIKDLYIWADGGLKTKETIHLFSTLGTILNVKIHLNYFAPYHGHSEVDAHFGQGKRNLRNQAKNGPIVCEEQIYSSFRQLPSTQVELITPLQAPSQLKPFSKQIKKWFEWFLFQGKIFCREKSGEGEWTEQFVQFI